MGHIIKLFGLHFWQDCCTVLMVDGWNINTEKCEITLIWESIRKACPSATLSTTTDREYVKRPLLHNFHRSNGLVQCTDKCDWINMTHSVAEHRIFNYLENLKMSINIGDLQPILIHNTSLQNLHILNGIKNLYKVFVQ